MKPARVVLMALAAAAAPLLARGAPAPASEPASSTSTVKAPDCAVPAPRPLLKGALYAGYAFERGPENTATEKASSGTVHIEIQFAGCQDGYEHGFVFTEDKPLASYDDRDHWLLFAAEQVKALKTYRRGEADVNDLLDFLSGAKIATARKNDSELRLEVCRDGSPNTEDGCSLKSGGGWRFAVRKLEKDRIEVYVSRYLALAARPRAPKASLGPLPTPK